MRVGQLKMNDGVGCIFSFVFLLERGRVNTEDKILIKGCIEAWNFWYVTLIWCYIQVMVLSGISVR